MATMPPRARQTIEDLQASRRTRRGRRRRPSITALRVAELNRLFRARYGDKLPDDDAGRDDAALMVHHLAALTGDPRRNITGWLELHAPWMAIAEAKTLMLDAIANPRRWRADRLAWRLRLTEADRATLAIRTIGAVDANKGTRQQARRIADRATKEARRRAKGMRPRHEYEAGSVARLKPWQALGMSRATWFRKGKPPAP